VKKEEMTEGRKANQALPLAQSLDPPLSRAIWGQFQD